MVKPLDVEHFVELLRESNYDPEEISFLQKVFSEGFDIEHDGPQDRKSLSDNIPFSVGNKTILLNKLMKEVCTGHVAGPYKEIPFENYAQSPIRLVPKAGSTDQTRLIFHLSYDFKMDGNKLINHYIPKDKCSVKYKDLDFAVEAIPQLVEKTEGTS